jgi:hypothetical protein
MSTLRREDVAWLCITLGTVFRALLILVSSMPLTKTILSTFPPKTLFLRNTMDYLKTYSNRYTNKTTNCRWKRKGCGMNID